MRTVPEWIAKHDDQAIPDRVKLRVFQKYEGRCYLSDRKIRPGDKWEIEHIIALCNGGEHRESNFAPALAAPHKIKTAADRREQARSRKIFKQHFGFGKRGRKIPGSRGTGIRKPVNGPAYRVNE